MPRRKSKPKEPETQPTPTVLPTLEKPVEVPAPAPKPETQPTTKLEIKHPAGFAIREATWEEFESFQPSPLRKEKGKSPLREAFEVAKSGKVVKIEGLAPAQVRAVLAVVSQWNYKERLESGKEPVRVKYDMKAGVVYLAPAEKPEKPAEKQ